MHKYGSQQYVRKSLRPWLWLGPLLYLLLIGAYFSVRFAGRWAEADSAIFAEIIRTFANSGQLVPLSGELYANGYAYQAISTFIIGVTGLDVAVLQQLVYPLLAALVALPAWVLFRELTGSARAAVLSTMLLLLQPEFLFVILRSSHEKFTRTLLLLCLFIMVRSFRVGDRPVVFATYIALFYLAVHGLIVSNNLHAHSFLLAIGIALILGRVLQWRNPHLRTNGGPILSRMPYVIVICIALVYLVIFYIYSPAKHDLFVMRDVWNRLASLFLDVQNRTNAYAQVSSGWLNLYVYFLVSLANWIILATSLVIWSYQGWRWIWRRELPPSRMAWLLWLLYAAFAFQGALSVLVDASGALSSNLQHRIFPSFSIAAVAIVGAQLAQLIQATRLPVVRPAFALVVFVIAILSVAKATNEPLLSNKWTFYRQEELSAMRRSDAHLHDATIWTGFDERLRMAYLTVESTSNNNNRFAGAGEPRSPARSFLLSSVTRLRAVRLMQPLPVPYDALRVYDNGTAELYRLRPLTPFQK